VEDATLTFVTFFFRKIYLFIFILGTLSLLYCGEKPETCDVNLFFSFSKINSKAIIGKKKTLKIRAPLLS
jgi:hypothetical protein